MPTVFVSVLATPREWLPWTIGVLITFWYSWDETRWHPEVPLVFDFAAPCVRLGMAVFDSTNVGRGYYISPFRLCSVGRLA